MIEKIVKVKNCDSCLFCDYNETTDILYCRFNDKTNEEGSPYHYIKESEKLIIPDWCPLKENTILIKLA